MAITATSTDSTTTSTLSFVCALGFTANAGDKIIVGVAADSAITAMAWPGSWAELGAEAVLSGARAVVAHLTAAGGETSVTITGSGTAERWEACIWRIPAGEWHGTTAPEIAASAVSSSANPNPPAITPSWGPEADTIFLVITARDDSVLNTITAYPTNYSTAQIDRNTLTSAANIGGAARIATATTEDPGTFTISAAESQIAWTIAVRPLAAAAAIYVPKRPFTQLLSH